jgi:hypothetical protein
MNSLLYVQEERIEAIGLLYPFQWQRLVIPRLIVSMETFAESLLA